MKSDSNLPVEQSGPSVLLQIAAMISGARPQSERSPTCVYSLRSIIVYYLWLFNSGDTTWLSHRLHFIGELHLEFGPLRTIPPTNQAKGTTNRCLKENDKRWTNLRSSQFDVSRSERWMPSFRSMLTLFDILGAGDGGQLTVASKNETHKEAI